MKVYLGADHNGFRLKATLADFLVGRGFEVEDNGGAVLDPEDDFPIFATKVVSAMKASDDKEPMGILICGSGQGMAMAANRYKGIRAAVIWNVDEAKLSRNDDDSNVLALPAHILDNDQKLAFDIVEAWLKTPFERIARRERRIKQMDEL